MIKGSIHNPIFLAGIFVEKLQEYINQFQQGEP